MTEETQVTRLVTDEQYAKDVVESMRSLLRPAIDAMNEAARRNMRVEFAISQDVRGLFSIQNLHIVRIIA